MRDVEKFHPLLLFLIAANLRGHHVHLVDQALPHPGILGQFHQAMQDETTSAAFHQLIDPALQQNLNVRDGDAVPEGLDGLAHDARGVLVLGDVSNVTGEIGKQLLKFVNIVIQEQLLDNVVPVLRVGDLRELFLAGPQDVVREVLPFGAQAHEAFEDDDPISVSRQLRERIQQWIKQISYICEFHELLDEVVSKFIHAQLL